MNDTKLAALASIQPVVGRLQVQILNHVRKKKNGCTNEVLSKELNIRLSSVCARVNELVGLGLLCDSNQREKGESGRYAKVWIASGDANAQYNCRTAVGGLVKVFANVNDSVESIKKRAEEEHKVIISDVVEEHRFIGAEDDDDAE